MSSRSYFLLQRIWAKRLHASLNSIHFAIFPRKLRPQCNHSPLVPHQRLALLPAILVRQTGLVLVAARVDSWIRRMDAGVPEGATRECEYTDLGSGVRDSCGPRGLRLGCNMDFVDDKGEAGGETSARRRDEKRWRARYRQERIVKLFNLRFIYMKSNPCPSHIPAIMHQSPHSHTTPSTICSHKERRKINHRG